MLLSKRAKDSSKGKILYHIGKQAPIPRPISISKFDYMGSNFGRTEEGWKRPWLKEPVQSGVFLTDEPDKVFKDHGITEGKIYSVFVPFWVIAESGGIHKYSGAREIIIPEYLWEYCKILSSKDIPKEFNYFNPLVDITFSDPDVEIVPELNEEDIIKDLKRSDVEKKLKKNKRDTKMKLSKRAMLSKKSEDFEVDTGKCPWCGADKVVGLGDEHCSDEDCQWHSDWEGAHEHDRDYELTHKEELKQLERDDEAIERAQERDLRWSEMEPNLDANDKVANLKFKLSKRG
jgi:hypothetical protein